MLNRRFTFRENVLLLILTILLLATFYYLFLLKPVSAEIRDNQWEQSQMEAQLEAEMKKAARKKQMQEDMKSQPKALSGIIHPYDNMKNEMKELDQILAAASSYNIDAQEPVAEGVVVRRDISISFRTETYKQACGIVEKIENGSLRCLVKNVDMLFEKEPQAVQGSVLVTYYETTIGAESLDGLVADNELQGDELWDDEMWDDEL